MSKTDLPALPEQMRDYTLASSNVVPRMGLEEERAHFSEWIVDGLPFERDTDMREHAAKTDAAWSAWQARSALRDWLYAELADVRRENEKLRAALSTPVAQEAETPKPDGKLHDDGYFTWNTAKHKPYERPAQLPCNFWLSPPAAQGAETLEPAMLTALRLAWSGQHDKAANYVELAAQRLEKDGETSKARWLRTALAEMQGKQEPTMIHALGAAQEVRQEPAAGWKLVPEDPTSEMLAKAMKDCGGIGAGSCGEHSGVDGDDMRGVWEAMLAAAPQPPQPVALTEEQFCASLPDEVARSYTPDQLEIYERGFRHAERAHGITGEAR